MKRVLILCILTLGLVFCNCSTLQKTSNSKNGKFETEWLNLKCFQTISNEDTFSSCLCFSNEKSSFSTDVYYIVSFTCPGKEKPEVFFDGKTFNRSFVFVGTYTYVTKKDEDVKTVRAYIPKKNFYELYEYNSRYLKEALDLLLSYNVLKNVAIGQ